MDTNLKIAITGGLGFIGGNFISYLKKYKNIHKIYNLDCQTYAANKQLIKEHQKIFKNKYEYKNINIYNKKEVKTFFKENEITHIINFAAESHVDNSIKDSSKFIDTNIIGVHNILCELIDNKKIRFLQVSTDEVFGSLNYEDESFDETSSLKPQNPYAATKASAELLVQSFINTYKIQAAITNCSNNYGPYQNKEKFIPKTIINLLNNKKVPIYSKGENIRDWLYVEDHCNALCTVLFSDFTGNICIGGGFETSNIEIVSQICKILNKNLLENIEFINDRPGHDFRYSISNKKINKIFGWKPCVSFKEGIIKTIDFYKNI